MLATITVGQVLAFLVSVAGFTALVTYVPFIARLWTGLPSQAQNAVLVVVAWITPGLLSFIGVYVPSTVQSLTGEQFIYNVFAAGAAIVIGYINSLFAVNVPQARKQLRLMSGALKNR